MQLIHECGLYASFYSNSWLHLARLHLVKIILEHDGQRVDYIVVQTATKFNIIKKKVIQSEKKVYIITGL